MSEDLLAIINWIVAAGAADVNGVTFLVGAIWSATDRAATRRRKHCSPNAPSPIRTRARPLAGCTCVAPSTWWGLGGFDALMRQEARKGSPQAVTLGSTRNVLIEALTQSQKYRYIGDAGELGQQEPECRVVAGPDRKDDLGDEHVPALRNGQRLRRGPTMVASAAEPLRIRLL